MAGLRAASQAKGGPVVELSRQEVLRCRFSAQQLDRPSAGDLGDAAILDLGVQDTGSDGAGWALANRGVAVSRTSDLENAFLLAWTLRGAPHLYRREEVAEVAAATAPFSSADAAKRIFDAAKPLRAAGIDPLEALDVVAGHLGDIVAEPMVKGEVSSRLTDRLPAPYLRDCRPCKATHVYEQPFRLGALRAGLELQAGTSPPVMRRVAGWQGRAEAVPAALDVVRGYLHLCGPAAPAMVAQFLDAPIADVKRQWPEDAVEVAADGERRWMLPEDVAAAREGGSAAGTIRLLSPYDLFLQVRDRELLVPDVDQRKAVWVVLGRPGAVVVDGEIVGLWRPRAAGGALKVAVERWAPTPEAALVEQAERLAVFRGVRFGGLLEL